MNDPIAADAALVDALKLTVDPPQAWIDAAALIPAILGDLDRLEELVADPSFRARFVAEPEAAVAAAGLAATPPLIAALRERLNV